MDNNNSIPRENEGSMEREQDALRKILNSLKDKAFSNTSNPNHLKKVKEERMNKSKKVKPKYSVFEVGVIGGGAAGIYSGYRLLGNEVNTETRNVKGKVVIIEERNEVGGRLKSQFFTDIPSIPVELGGMRFSEKHLLVRNLVEELKLDYNTFNYELDGYIFRGNKIAKSNLATDAQKYYSLFEKEKNKTPKQLIELAIQTNFHIPNFINFTESEKEIKIKDLLKKGYYQNIFLYELTWSAFLRNTLSAEGIALIKDSEGYNSNFDNMSAAEGLKDLTRFDDNFFSLRQGYQSLVKALADKFVKLGGEIKLDHEVIRFKKILDDPSNTEIKRITKNLIRKKLVVPEFYIKVRNSDKTEEYILCDKIIMGIPKNAILKLDQFTNFFDPNKNIDLKNAINSIQEMKSLKVYIHFDYDWWSHHNLSQKKIYTDGSIRMAYFLGCEGDINVLDKHNRNSIMLVYVDQKASEEFPTPRKALKDTSSSINASHTQLVNFLQKHIKDLVDLYTGEKNDVPNILNIAYWYWDEAYHCFKPHENASEIAMYIIKPITDYNVYICGSAYSSKQSWVEGAFLTAEYMLQTYFNVKPIESIPTNYISDQMIS